MIYWVVAAAMRAGCDEHTIAISGEPVAQAAAESSAPAVLETRLADAAAPSPEGTLSDRERRREARAMKRALRQQGKAAARQQAATEAAAATGVETAVAPEPLAAESPAAVAAAPEAPAQSAAKPASARTARPDEKSVLKSASKVSILSVVKVTGGLFEGFVVTVRVRNQSSMNISIYDGRADIYMDGSRTIAVRQQEGVTIPKNATTDIAVPLSVSLTNPLLALALYTRAKQKKFDGIDLSYSIEGSALGFKRRFADEHVPVKKILDKTGYSIEGL